MTNRALKVLHVVDTLSMGGAETWLMEVLRTWFAHGIGRMDFLVTSGNRGLFDEEAVDLGARIYYLRFSRSSLVRFTTRFRKLLRAGDYDAIHDHQDYASGWHFLMGAGRLPRVRVVHVHNPWLHIEANYGISRLRRLSATLGKHLVGRMASHVCGTSAEILSRYGFERTQSARPIVRVLHCGFDIGRFEGRHEEDRNSVLAEFDWPPDTKLVLFAGRLDRALEFDHPQNHKNSWFALNVMRMAIEKEASVRFLMAGSGGDVASALARHIDTWGLSSEIRLLGVREDIPRLMRGSDLLFFPSRQEGLGMVAVEAQAAGLPVLASTAVPDEAVVIPELFTAVSLREPLDHWAAVLLEKVSNRPVALAPTRRALEASEFAIKNSARRLEEIYSGAQ